MLTLKKRLKQGLVWNFANLFSNEALRFILKIIVARILLPDDFGLFAITAIVLSVLSILNSFGTASAFIRDDSSNIKKAKNTLFYIDGFIDLLIFFISFTLAPHIAQFFTKNNPQHLLTLSWMIRVLSTQKIIKIFTNVPRATLTRGINLKNIDIATIVYSFVYVILAIILVYNGFGVWSFVYGLLAAIIVESILIFTFSPFIPSFIFDKKIAKKYFNFGKNVFVSSFVNIVIREGDNAIIGRVLGAGALGFYHLGEVIVNVVIDGIGNSISSVIFPVFSRIQHEKKRLQSLYFKTFEFTNLIIVPAIAGLFILANDLVILLLGDKWLPIVPLIYVFGTAALLRSILYPSGSFFAAKNKPFIGRNVQLLNFIAYVFLIYPFVLKFGMLGAAYVLVIFSIISIVYVSHHLIKEIKGFFTKFLKIYIFYIFLSLIMMSVIYYINSLLTFNFFTAILLILIGAFVYFGLIFLFKKQILIDLIKFIKGEGDI